MQRKLALFAIAALVLAPFRVACAVDTPANDLNNVLQKLDTAAKNFHTTAANFEFDSIQTDPVPDTDVMTGTTYYERSGAHFQMAAHVRERTSGDTSKEREQNKHPARLTYIFSGGVLRQSDTGGAADARTIERASKYESYLLLGFGASGKELAEKWDIKYLGTEKIDGIATDKLELVAKDPTVLKNIPKVTIWMDTARAVSLKQVFDEGQGQSRVCHYTDITVNQPLPKTAFSFDK